MRKLHRHKLRPSPAFEIRRSAIHGTGAFALRNIRKGEMIIEYIGERISHEEADRRYEDEAMEMHHTFLFAVDDEICIDAAVGGNDARFINHSCQPNCAAYNIDGRIYIEAIRTIAPGDELSYDYAYQFDEADEELSNRYRCLCGTSRCRGTIVKVRKRRKKKTELRSF